MFLRNITFICALLLMWNGSVKGSDPTGTISIDSKKITLSGVPFSFTINILDANGEIDHSARGVMELYGFKIVGADGIHKPPAEVETRNQVRKGQGKPPALEGLRSTCSRKKASVDWRRVRNWKG